MWAGHGDTTLKRNGENRTEKFTVIRLGEILKNIILQVFSCTGSQDHFQTTASRTTLTDLKSATSPFPYSNSHALPIHNVLGCKARNITSLAGIPRAWVLVSGTTSTEECNITPTLHSPINIPNVPAIAIALHIPWIVYSSGNVTGEVATELPNRLLVPR